MNLKLRVEALEARKKAAEPLQAKCSDEMMRKIVMRALQLADDATHPLHEYAKAFVETFLASEPDPVAVNLAFNELVDEVRSKRREV